MRCHQCTEALIEDIEIEEAEWEMEAEEAWSAAERAEQRFETFLEQLVAKDECTECGMRFEGKACFVKVYVAARSGGLPGERWLAVCWACGERLGVDMLRLVRVACERGRTMAQLGMIFEAEESKGRGS